MTEHNDRDLLEVLPLIPGFVPEGEILDEILLANNLSTSYSFPAGSYVGISLGMMSISFTTYKQEGMKVFEHTYQFFRRVDGDWDCTRVGSLPIL